MTQRGPWSVKGIDSRARDAAREAAREEGMTLGAYLNKLILEEGMPAAVPQPVESAATRPDPRPRRASSEAKRSSEQSATALDRLTRRIESAEARSTLAITGIDQSVVGLLSRLENAEHNQQAMGSHFEGILEDIQKTYQALNVKVTQVEKDDSSAKNLQALKALEDALGKLASHVYEENELVSEESSAIKARLESGLDDLTTRMGDIDAQIEGKLEVATRDFNQAVADAELRAEGASRHLAERFSAVELDVADKLTHVGQMSATMDGVHAEVQGSLNDMNDTLGQIQERLSRAETLTDKAMHGLETRFEALDTRLADVQIFANADADQRMRQQFEERFESLSDDLRGLVALTRTELAKEIEAAAKSIDSNILGRIEGSIGTLGERLDASEDMHAQTMEMVGDTVARVTESVDQRLTATQDQQSRAIEQVGQQVKRISDGLDQRIAVVEESSGKMETDALREEMIRFTNTLDERLEFLETREGETFDKISNEVEKLADKLDERVVEGEKRSASAIEQIGEQVAGVTKRLEQRQTEALGAFYKKLDASQKRQEARLSGALGNVSDRLERMQEQSMKSMSPVQKAISALAQRIEAIEDFSAPPYVDRGQTPSIPDMVAPAKIDTNLNAQLAGEPTTPTAKNLTEEPFDIEPPAGFLDPIFADDGAIPESTQADEDTSYLAADLDIGSPLAKTDEDEFEPGIQTWADDANAVLDDTLSTDAVFDTETATAPADVLPPPILNENLDEELWSDGRDEARDSDIFGDDFPTSALGAEQDKISEFEVAANFPELAEEPAEPESYISKARRAARAAADTTGAPGATAGKKKDYGDVKDGGNRKRIGLAALAAVAVAGTAGVLLMRNGGDTSELSLDDKDTATASVVTAATSTPDSSSSEAIDSDLAIEEDPSVVTDNIETDTGTLGSADNDGDVGQVAENTESANTTSGNTEPSLIPDPAPVVTPSPTTVSRAFTAPRIPTSPTLEHAAQQGNRIAQYQFGLRDLKNERFEEGAEWLEKSAIQGLAPAQYELAILHENGIGTTRDQTEARRWHSAAARAGNVDAMYNFATYNYNGEGGSANSQVAAEWFRKAAEFGHTDGQFNIASLYADGDGVSPSQIEAYYWYQLAAKGGDAAAKQAAEEIVANGAISQEAVALADQRVAGWRPAKPAAISNGEFSANAWQSNTQDQVLPVQQVLEALGYPVGTADGVMGGQTRSAIRAYETAAGLPVSGQITNRLVESLNAAADERRRSS